MSYKREVFQNASAFGRPLWTLRKDGREIVCVLREYGNGGFADIRILRDGRDCAGQRFDRREPGIAHSEELFEDLCRTGWQPVQATGDGQAGAVGTSGTAQNLVTIDRTALKRMEVELDAMERVAQPVK